MRCAFCHDAVDPGQPGSEVLSRCRRCHTALHPGCWQEARRCPTLGCGTPLRRRGPRRRLGVGPPDHAASRPGLAQAGLYFGGVILPVLAFGFDSALQFNPVLWGDPAGGCLPGGGLNLAALEGKYLPVGAWQVFVYTLIALSLLGMLRFTLAGLRDWITSLLLGLGVVLAAAHSAVFLPLLPLSLLGLLLAGLGILGLSPYLALWAYLYALRASLRAPRQAPSQAPVVRVRATAASQPA